MSLENPLITNFMQRCQDNWKDFLSELESDENKDYRRGFKAGILCSHLQLKAEIKEYVDAVNQQSTR